MWEWQLCFWRPGKCGHYVSKAPCPSRPRHLWWWHLLPRPWQNDGHGPCTAHSLFQNNCFFFLNNVLLLSFGNLVPHILYSQWWPGSNHRTPAGSSICSKSKPYCVGWLLSSTFSTFYLRADYTLPLYVTISGGDWFKWEAKCTWLVICSSSDRCMSEELW